jgi:cytochrome bd ubiquinol oxidase subunit II
VKDFATIHKVPHRQPDRQFGTERYFPILVMLLALIFRGLAFEFRLRDSENKTFWDRAFCYGPAIATFEQGMVLGSFIQGFRVSGRQFSGTSFDFLPVRSADRRRVTLRLRPIGRRVANPETEGDVQTAARRNARMCLAGIVLAIAIVGIWMPFLNESGSARWFMWPRIALLAPVPLATAAVAWLIWRVLANQAQLTAFRRGDGPLRANLCCSRH